MNNQSLWSDAYRRLINNKAAVISACILAILILAAIFAPFLASHSYAYQNLELGATPPSPEYLLVLIHWEEICSVESYMEHVSHF